MPNTNNKKLTAVQSDPEGELAAKVQENYLRLFEAIRGERPKPKRGGLRAVN